MHKGKLCQETKKIRYLCVITNKETKRLITIRVVVDKRIQKNSLFLFLNRNILIFHLCGKTNRQTDKQTDKQTHRVRRGERRKERQSGEKKKTDNQTDRQTDRQIDTDRVNMMRGRGRR